MKGLEHLVERIILASRWSLVVFYFFRRFTPTWKEDNTYRRSPLTFEQVQSEFESAPPPHEPIP